MESQLTKFRVFNRNFIMEDFYELKFTWEEVVKRSSIENGKLQLLKRVKNSDKPPEGKEFYTALLCQKAADAIAIPPRPKPNYSVYNTLASYPNGIMRCYLKCDHGKTSPAAFIDSDLKEDYNLTWTFKNRCLKCVGRDVSGNGDSTALIDLTTMPIVAINSALQEMPSVATREEGQLVTSEVANVVSSSIERTAKRFSATLARIKNLCSASIEPKKHFLENKDRFLGWVIDDWERETLELSTVPEALQDQTVGKTTSSEFVLHQQSSTAVNTSASEVQQTSNSSNEVQTSTGPLRTINDALKYPRDRKLSPAAAKRIQEQKEALAKKPRLQ